MALTDERADELELAREQADMLAADNDIMQEFSLIVEEAARRSCRKRYEAGLLTHWFRCGERDVRVSLDEAAPIIAGEIATEAVEHFLAFDSADLKRARRA